MSGPSETSGALPVAVIGLGSSGQAMAEVLSERDDVSLVGLTDRDVRRVEQMAEALDAPAYHDTRQLLLTAKPSAVFLAVPPMRAGELVDTCLRNGIHVWKDAPLGRDLGEAASMARRFAEAKLTLVVGVQRRFAETYRRAGEWLGRLGPVRLARGHYLFHWGGSLGWRADRASAGGGALLEIGYPLIDLLVGWLGTPEEVYGVTAVDPPTPESDRAQHDTDDSAAGILRFAGNTTATITVSRQAGPTSEGVALYGAEGSLIVSAGACTLRGLDGEVLDHEEVEAPARQPYSRQIDAFLQAIGDPKTPSPADASKCLLAHAVVDALYLSARTAQPEYPARQLHIHGVA